MGREELEDIWREHLKEAQLRWDFARNYLTEVQRDFPIEDAKPDDQFAHQRALRLENLARTQYQRVLRIYTKLVLEGQIPDDDWQKRKAAAVVSLGDVGSLDKRPDNLSGRLLPLRTRRI